MDVLACPACGGRLELIAFIANAGVAKRILDHLGLDAQAPPLAKSRDPGDLGEPGPDDGTGDPQFDE